MPHRIDIDVHPAANLFPMPDEKAIAELAGDIKQHGQLLDITKYKDGRLLDGRTRYVACRIAGVEPRFGVYAGDDPVGFAWSMNGPRRHLTPSQKAMAAAAMATLRAGDNQHSKEVSSRELTSKNGHGDIENADFAKTQKQAANEVGTSVASVKRAAKVMREAEPAVVSAVESGKLTVNKATKVAKLKPETQRKIAAAPKPEQAARDELDQEGCSDNPRDLDPLHNAKIFDEATHALSLATKHVNSLTGPRNAPKPLPGAELLSHHRQEFDAHVRNAAEVLKGTKPYSECPYCLGKSKTCAACKGTGWVIKRAFEDAPKEKQDKVRGGKK